MSHPDDEMLRLFAVGTLTERQGDEIESHLAGCEACARRLDDIERNKSDSFLHKMKAAGTDETSDDFTPGSLVGGHFQLEKQLGRGGMGIAWKAYDVTAGRHVALKFVPKDVLHFSEALDAVLESFKHVHALQHSHICPLYILDNDAEHGFFLVMKYVDGPSLDTCIRRKHGTFLFDTVMKTLGDVADALDYAHARKVIHRDIKPANIMLDPTDGVQVIDFGLADEIRASMSRTADLSVVKVTGTRSYMAPEQWRGGRQDARTDQYALAVTAYELLAGHVPFQGTDTDVLKNCVLNDAPAPIPGMPKHVNATLLKGLAKRRENRFETCKAFVEALANPSGMTFPPVSEKTQSVPWKLVVPAITVSVLLLILLTVFLIQRPWKPNAEVNTSVTGESAQSSDTNTPQTIPEDEPGHIGVDLEKQITAVYSGEMKTDKPAGQADSGKMPPSFRPQPARNNELFRVVRVTVELDDKAIGRLIVKRGLSAEPYPAFRGTQFHPDSFHNAMFFRNPSGMNRVVFPKGDVSLAQTLHSLALQQRAPFGWEYWAAGASHVNRYGGLTRYRLQGRNERAGLSIGKRGNLPCAITFEVVDNDDALPYFEMVLYQSFEQEIKSCTISCWGEKEANGRLRFSAAYSHPFMDGGQTFIAEDVAVEKNMMFSNVFQLPPVVRENVEMIKYALWVRPQNDKPTLWTGFDLTFLDLIGRFKAEAGFTVDQRGNTPIVGRVDPNGPAENLPPGAEILSINDKSGSVTELQKMLDSLNFGDEIKVRFVPQGGGGSITRLFYAE